MASYLRRQDNLETLKTRNLFLQGVTGAYPPDQSILTISGSLGQVVTSNSITVQSLIANSITTQSLSTCQLIAANGLFNVNCPTGQVDMYPPGITIGGTQGQSASSVINLHGGITGGTTAQQYILQMKIQAQTTNDISGVPISSTMGIIGIADASGGFRAPVIGLDASANKMRIVQYFSNQGNIPAVTIDNNYQLEPLPLNQAPHCGRINAHQIQVGGYMGVNIYNNDYGFQPVLLPGITWQYGGAALRNSPLGPVLNINRYPTVVTAWQPTAGATVSKNYNLITMDVSNGFIGIRKTQPIYTLDVSGNINASGSISAFAKPFNIPHPLSNDKRLVFCAVEGPRCDLIYRGCVALTAGTATVHLDTQSTADGTNGMTPGTFSALARNPQVYLQNNETFDAVKGSVQGDTLTIQCANAAATATIDWMVVAERKDATMYNTIFTDANGYLVNEHPATS